MRLNGDFEGAQRLRELLVGRKGEKALLSGKSLSDWSGDIALDFGETVIAHVYNKKDVRKGDVVLSTVRLKVVSGHQRLFELTC